MHTRRHALRTMTGLMTAGILSGRVFGQEKEVTIADQFGIAYLPTMLMQERKLVEKHAAAAGLGSIKVNWARFGGAGTINDALLSGAVQFATVGTPGLILVWDKTKGTGNEVKGICSLTTSPMYLNTRNPLVKSIKDLTDQDKIALPAVKSSFQAIALQMAAAREFGIKNYTKLDRLTVSMKHPDAMASLLSGKGELSSHFASAPFMYQELKRPGIRRILSTQDLGGETSFVVAFTTSKFRQANPQLYAAFLSAMDEAISLINRDRLAAATTYVSMTKGAEGEIPTYLEILANPENPFSTTPKGIQNLAGFMHSVGTIKNKPASWKDLFFENIHGADGN